MLDKLKAWLTENIHPTDFVFGGLWLYAWFHNAESAVKLDIDKLINFYGIFRAYILGGKLVDSKWNSPQGVPPTKGDVKQ